MRRILEEFITNLERKRKNLEDNEEGNDLTECLREEIVRWACILNISECQYEAHIKLKEELINLDNITNFKKR